MEIPVRLPHNIRVEKLFEIIHEDAELLVINKAAGLVCHPSKNGEMSSLIGRVRLHLGGGARPHLVNRLDRETSGVVIAAKTDEAARELRQLWESRDVQKEYLALVHGHVREDTGCVEAPLGKDESSRVAIKDCVRADGSPSQTEFFVVKRFHSGVPNERPAASPSPPLEERAGARGQREQNESSVLPRITPHPDPLPSEGRGNLRYEFDCPFTLLRVLPRTGRKHQIRIHLAHIGHPIVGDKIYGGDEDCYLALVENRLTLEQRTKLILPHQALHARAVRFEWRGRTVEFICEPEPWFSEFASETSRRRETETPSAKC